MILTILFIVIVAAIVYWIISQLPGVPSFLPMLVWAVALLLIVFEVFGGLGADTGHTGRLP